MATIIWIYGCPASGKTTLLHCLRARLGVQAGGWWDGTEERCRLGVKDFGPRGRWQLFKHLKAMAQDLTHNPVLVATILPYRQMRKELMSDPRNFLIYLTTPEATRRARLQQRGVNRLEGWSGFGGEWEEPHPDEYHLRFNTAVMAPELIAEVVTATTQIDHSESLSAPLKNVLTHPREFHLTKGSGVLRRESEGGGYLWN